MITALIPARSGSKRVVHKNIRKLGGKHLFVYSIEAAQECKFIERVYVSTDSETYAQIAKDAGAKVIIRPPEYAADDSTDYNVVQHFMRNEKAPAVVDMIVYLRPTTPLRKSYTLEAAITGFNNWLQNATPKPTSLRSVEEMSESAYKCMEIFGGRLEGICGYSVEEAGLPNQMFRKTYKPNGYIDIILPHILNSGKLWGRNAMGFVTEPVTEVDSIRELNLLEWELNARGKWNVSE